jgi:hypothetical protein
MGIAEIAQSVYVLDGQCLIPGWGQIFLFSMASRLWLWAYPASCPMGMEGCFPGDKEAGV